MAKLNPKQARFVAEYVIDANATRAALAAGYSKSSAASQAHDLLKNPKIAQLIERGLQRQLKKAELTADMVLAEIRKVAFVDLADAYDEKGFLLHPQDMPADVRAALNAVETDEIRLGGKIKIGERKKIKLVDKIRALEMLAKNFKLLTEVHELANRVDEKLVLLTMPANGSEAKVEEPKPEAAYSESTPAHPGKPDGV